MRNTLAVLISGLILALLAGYTVFWHVTAARIDAQIDLFPQWAAEQGINLSGGFGKAYGFPRRHQVEFTGVLEKDGAALSIPHARISGFPLPGQEIEIDLSDGGWVDSRETDPEIWSLDQLFLTVAIPTAIPPDLTIEALRAWRAAGGRIEIGDFIIRKDSLHVRGSGMLSLDNDLQPEGSLKARIGGYAAFLGFLQGKKLIEAKQALVTGAVLAGLSRQDPASGERYIQADLTLQNGMVLLGPLSLLSVPEITWAYDGPGPVE